MKGTGVGNSLPCDAFQAGFVEALWLLAHTFDYYRTEVMLRILRVAITSGKRAARVLRVTLLLIGHSTCCGPFDCIWGHFGPYTGPFWPITAYFRLTSGPLPVAKGSNRCVLPVRVEWWSNKPKRTFCDEVTAILAYFRSVSAHFRSILRSSATASVPLAPLRSAALRCAPPRPRLKDLGGHYTVIGHFGPFPVYFRPFPVTSVE